MKIFSVAVEEGREGEDGKPSLGPVYRNLLAQNDFPPPDRQINSSWDLFRCFQFSTYSMDLLERV